MGGIANTLLSDVEKLTIQQNSQPLTKLEPVRETEDVIDHLQAEIIHYLSVIVSRNDLTERQSNLLANLMHTASDIERIGDHCTNIAELAAYQAEERIVFSEQAYEELKKVFGLSAEMSGLCLRGLEKDDHGAAHRVLELEQTIDALEKELRQSHLERLSSGTCNPKSAVCYTEIMKNLERIADHCNNIAEAVLNQRPHSLIK